MRRWKPLFLTALMLLSILPVLTVDAGESKSSTHAVDIQNFAFNPQDITIIVGDSITWTNQDSSSHTATSTSGPASFDSGNMQSSSVFTYTFTASGTYNYECSFHPSMTGSVTVENPAVRVRDTLTSFTWQPEEGEAQPNNVSIIGEWDWDTHSDLTFNSNSGTWSTSISLQEGLYCYKFVIGDNDYRFDESNPYRGYCGDFENSITRVENTGRPALSLDSYSTDEDGFSAHILFWAGGNAAAPDTVTATLVHNFVESQVSGSWNSDNWSLSISMDELSPGKYTLKVAGSDINNDEAEELLLPFWIGEESDFIWDDALIYMVMTDRFVDGNSANNPVATSAAQGADWQGGDFAGVTQMIQSGYFNNLGVNALWLTPFNTAANGTGIAGDGQHEVSSYHGYWPIEPRGVDARLGTEAELEELISTAHEHGIRVMSDLVVNHVHEDHPYYSNNPDWFNQGCLCGTQNCDWTEHRLDCQFRSYMPDINWKNRDASEQMIADGLWWLERFDLDGARIDAVKHVDDLAIYNFGTQVEERFETMGTDYYLKGETAMGWAGHNLVDNQEEFDMINRYMGEHGLDGQADFVLYHAVVDNVFTSGNMDYQHLDYWTARSQDQYADGSTMVPFVGSHDVPRFTSRADPGTADEWNQWQEDGLPGQPGNDLPYQAALQAYAWLLTTPGAPMIYMGDEYGEFGGADPDNRHMWRNNSNINSREFALMENISAIAQLRKDSDALRRGSYESLTNSTDTIAWSMTTSSEQVVVAMNRGEISAGFDLELNWLANDSLNGIEMDENHSFTLGPHTVAIFLQHHNNNSSPIQGCTNSSATNYNPLAEVDDGSCQYSSPPVEGCTNSSATNYNPSAEVDDGSCQYSSPPIEGCTNSSATNYNPSAEVDDDSCQYSSSPVEGCSNSSATNYNPLAEVDDGSCTYTNPLDNNTNQTGNQSSNSSANESGNQTNPEEEPMDDENNTNSENNVGENNQDTTTETGGVASGSLVVYALLIVLVIAIIGFVLVSIRRP
ncbi:MAG: alpha-amylase family glycosyl hydrolase [Candidatus Thalassarchaeaceae archaeon]|nr:alpha-amylase family glycosyl hydrolase [Candidatus Thalassarchaeaceae archaeon]